jgi:hypothetical protein
MKPASAGFITRQSLPTSTVGYGRYRAIIDATARRARPVAIIRL